MKKRNIITIVICLLSLFSCEAGKKDNLTKTVSELKSFTDGLVKEDTLAVEKLVNDYMSYIKSENYAEAAAMLFKPDTANVWNEPIALDNKEMDKVIETLKHFPVQSYKITKIEFKTAVENEVRCSFIMKNSVTSSYSFRPMNYLGGWRLCLME